jgi:plastocyanin
VRGLALAAATLGCLLAAAACSGEPATPPPPPPGAIPAGHSIGSGVVEGRVRFEGTAPPRRPIRMSEASCQRPGSEALSEDLIVSPQGALKNVYVHVVSGLGDRVFAAPSSPALMDQAGCAFVPHVLDVQAGQVIEFGNSDAVVHNVRALGDKNKVFNISMPGRGKAVRRYFTAPEIVKIRCDIHAWMSAFITVEAHPFHAVTGDDGAFALRGLPAGTYTVEAWQEKLGGKSQTVTVPEGGTATIEFVYTSGAAR